MAILQIVVPAYNEETIIFDNLVKINDEVSQWCNDFRIIVVNDGSADKTLNECLRAKEVLENLVVISYDDNRGKGAALKEGVSAADHTGYIVFLDADLDISPDQIKLFLQDITEKSCDAVIGSKLHKDSIVDYPFSRKVISYCYYLIVRLLFGLHVHDTQTGLKMFKAERIKPVMEVILVKKYAFDIEVLAILNHLGAIIMEEKVNIVFSRTSPFGRIKLADIWYMALDTLAVFYRLRILKYYDRKMKLL